jgi:hypothetical protein
VLILTSRSGNGSPAVAQQIIASSRPRPINDASRARCLQRPRGDIIENTIKFGFVSHRVS